jgi:hypothetical protein
VNTTAVNRPSDPSSTVFVTRVPVGVGASSSSPTKGNAPSPRVANRSGGSEAVTSYSILSVRLPSV